MKKGLLFGLSGMFLLLLPYSVGAQSFVLNGSATSLGGNCYRLTPDVGGQSGNILSTNPIDLTQEFAFDAVFNFGNKDANGADGIVFLMTTSNTITGVGGGGIGYQGITPSIAIEYDDYLNGWGDPAQDHMAIISMGILDHNQPTNLAGPDVLPNIEDGEDHCFSFLWDPVSQTFAGSLDGELISYTGDIVTNIFGGNPIVYFGFSSGTGSLSNLHIVCFGPPQLQPMPDVTVCQGESIVLEADENGIAWDWDPNPTLDELDIQNPTATPVMTTTYYVDITYACEGFARDTVVVTVIPEPNATAINNGPVCPGENVQLFATGGTSYDWDGPNGYSSTQQNPVITNMMPGNAGIYTVTVTDANGCTTTAETEVELFDLPAVSIDPVDLPLCEDGDPVQLIGVPSGGDWSGMISPGGVFDPADAGEGDHIVIYTVTDGNGCTNSEEITIEVVPNTPAQITPNGPFCVTDFVVTLTANPPGGTWGESADSDGQIYPGTLGVGSHLVTYELTGQDECYNVDFFVEIVDAPVVNIVDLMPLCADDPAQTLTVTPPGGTWSGATSNGQIDPAVLGQGTFEVIYTYSLPGGCSDSDTSEVVILPDGPQIQNLVFTCDGSNTTYTISFEITGGDPSTYSVQGSVPGSITPTNPYIYTSQSIPSENPYNFVVTDAANCGPIVLSGNYSCLCGTNAGSLDGFRSICENGIIEVGSPLGWNLDANDTMVFILHTGNPDSILFTGQGNGDDFALIPPMVTGVVYYVSAMVGNQIFSGIGVDTTDPCLSISSPMALIWYPFPEVSLTAPSVICSGDSIDLVFNIDGIGPYSITYSDGINSFMVDNIDSGYTVSLHPSVTTTYTLDAIQMTNDPRCPGTAGTSVTVAVVDVLHAQQSIAICEGDSIFLENSFQHLPGVYQDTLLASLGCDSIVMTTLTLYPQDTTRLQDTSCDTMQAGVFINTLTNQNGCDSIVITTVTFVEADTTLLLSATCDPSMAGMFIEIFMSQDGCDSFVIRTVELLPADTSYLFSNTCDPQAVGTYMTLLTNAMGCDSLVIEDISLVPSDTVAVQSVSCMLSDTGVFVQVYQNTAGCDSIVTATVTLAPSYAVDITSTTCDAQAAGMFSTTYQTIDGCDSVVTELITLLPSDTSYFGLLTCEPADTGSLTQPFTNIFGCDSLVIWITSLAPADSCVVLAKDVYVPNVFTPNSDGNNDNFFIMGNPEVVAGIRFLQIFDRWGGLVIERRDFLPNDPLYGWDGTLKGERMNPGVFVWNIGILYTDGTEEVLYGDVTLVR